MHGSWLKHQIEYRQKIRVDFKCVLITFMTHCMLILMNARGFSPTTIAS